MGVTKQGLAIFSAILLTTTAATSAWAEEAKKEAVIKTVSSDGTLNAQTREGPLTVVLTPTTKINETSGIAKRTTRDAKSLIPGLIFTVEGDLQGDRMTAEEIKFKKDDWKTAVATKAGTTELRQAIIDGNEYVIQQEATVYFASGSATISAAHKHELDALAAKAPSYGNYRISVLGFTDPVGNPEANEKLSLRRAGAVSNYLRQTGKIQPGRVLSPSAMGEGTTAPGEAAPTSNDQKRRVVVRVVTPKTQLTQ
jgi:outer membrane protein OmpA-like peptidoglycan-associated protein